jgi:hypothetical protein
MKATFTVYPGSKGEKKHSRRYGCEDEKFPLQDIYVKRPFATGNDTIEITIKEK